ncbi:MAG: pilin [Patescibacteria group bacterium]
MKHFFTAFFIAAIVVPMSAAPAFGAVEPPYKEIEYCYRIDNIDDYPEFMFLARFQDDEDVQLSEGECFSRQSADEIVSVRKDGLSAKTISSGITAPVSPVKVYNLSDSRKKIEDIFTIDALDEQAFTFRLAKKIVQFDDGSIRERVYATAEEGLADPPASEYRYTDPPVQPSAWWLFSHQYVDPRDMARNIINVALGIGSIVSLAILVWSCILYCLRAERRSHYRKVILFSILSLFIIFVLWIVAYFFLTTLTCCAQR